MRKMEVLVEFFLHYKINLAPHAFTLDIRTKRL